MTFGELLRRHRLAKRFSQEELAAKAHISVQSIGALERSVRRAPYRPTVEQLALALELSTDERADFESAASLARARGARATSNPSVSGPPHNLPAAGSSLVGRDDDIELVTSLLAKHRMVTITGSGGVGKTRAAIEVGRRYLAERAEEVWFIDLAPLTDGRLIPGRIASTLVPPLTGHADTMESIATALGSKRCLIIVDGCEHLINEASHAAHEILRACPNVSLLATSRERLSIIGESLYRLPSLTSPLHVPRTVDEAKDYSAFALFVERATAADRGFSASAGAIEVIVDICRRLDGIPLAIELAVARIPLLGLWTLRTRLDESFSLAGVPRDLPGRHQTMLATIMWSYNLLSEPERVLLSRLTIFVGGFTLRAAEMVCQDSVVEESAILPLLSSLVDKSLISVVHAKQRTRYTMLDSLRSFGAKSLELSGDRNAVARRHAEWLVVLADELVLGADASMEYSTYLEIAPEFDNVRAALNWCHASSDQDEILAVRIILGLRGLWNFSESRSDLMRVCREALGHLDEERWPVEASLLLETIIKTDYQQPRCAPDIERAIRLNERIADRKRLAAFYSMLTWVYADLNQLPDAERAADRSMALTLEEGLAGSIRHANILVTRSRLYMRQGRFDDSRADLAEAAAIATNLRNPYYVVAYCLAPLAYVEFSAGNLERAEAVADEMLAGEYGSVRIVAMMAYEYLACVRLRRGNLAGAEIASRELLRQGRGDETLAIQYLATIAALRGRAVRAATLLGFVDVLIERTSMVDPLSRHSYETLQRSLSEQLSAGEIASQAAIGASFTLEYAVAEALAAVES